MKTIVNVGCGMNIIPGAINMDNSPSIKIARHAVFRSIARHFLNKEQAEYINFAINNNIIYGEALKLPFSDNSIDVIYTSHMVEHLDISSMDCFIKECHRCLKPQGILRIVTPNLDIFINNYNNSRNAITFAINTMFYRVSYHSFKEKVRMLLIGDRNHKILYNAETLTQYLSDRGFLNCVSLCPGTTTIPFETNIDLSWRAEDSLYVEARKV